VGINQPYPAGLLRSRSALDRDGKDHVEDRSLQSTERGLNLRFAEVDREPMKTIAEIAWRTNLRRTHASRPQPGIDIPRVR
jgi:hypothetical protein